MSLCLGKTTHQPGFEVICRVEANLEKCFEIASTKTSPNGKLYRDVNVSVHDAADWLMISN